MHVYRLANNNRSRTKRMVVVTIELIQDHTDMTNLNRNFSADASFINTLYYPFRINAGKIINILSLDNKQQFNFCYINRVKYCKNNYFKFTGYCYDDKEDPIPDKHYLTVYKTRDAALDGIIYIPQKYTGIKLSHYSSGKLLKKCYYFLGKLSNMVVYYNNQNNSVKHNIKYYNGTQHQEMIYDTIGELVCKYTFDDSGRIAGSNSYSTTILPSYFQSSKERQRLPRRKRKSYDAQYF